MSKLKQLFGMKEMAEPIVTITPIKTEPAEIRSLSELATEIVREHFDPIIGPAQNDYMLKRFQSVEALNAQLEEGYQYYWVSYGVKHVGFLAYYPKGKDLYLSKFYVHSSYRGKHIATTMMEFLVAEASAKKADGIHLNVNRNNNDVISIYQHLGFEIIREEVNDIGNGFVMDDYVLRYVLKNA